MEEIKREKDGKNIKAIIVILVFMFIVVLMYIVIIKPISCENEKCFFDSLNNCKRVEFVKEDSEYSWSYLILKEDSKDSCEVRVELLNVKKEVSYSKILENKEMICIVSKTITSFPEKDILRCKGELKEELQELIIQRMYDYLLANIKEINKSFFESL